MSAIPSGIDIKMEIGQASESITVAAEALTLQTETADKGLVINDTEILQLPLNGRNPFMLSMLSAGVNYNGSEAVPVRPFDNGAIANWSINGGPQNMNEFLLDGAPNNAQAGGNNLAFVTPVDSVRRIQGADHVLRRRVRQDRRRRCQCEHQERHQRLSWFGL